MGPSLEIGINKRKEKSRKGENETCGMEESGGEVSLTFDQFGE